jgi:hypothetical protein
MTDPNAFTRRDSWAREVAPVPGKGLRPLKCEMGNPKIASDGSQNLYRQSFFDPEH